MGNRTCSVDGCDRPHSGRGYCAVHYQHWYRWGDPLKNAPEPIRQCGFPACTGKHDSHGYCSAHAKQLARGEELRTLRPFWNGALCAVETCSQPVVARGWCARHWHSWRVHGDPTAAPPRRGGPDELVRPQNGRPIVHRRRKRGSYTLDEGYFDLVESEDQAYWLGFITADGGVTVSRKSYTLKLDLSARDADHVHLFSRALSSNRPVRYRTRRGHHFAVAQADSWHLIESLDRLGVTPRKSATAAPWAGPSHLMPHYWRGLFDGDGSITVTSTRNSWQLGICGSEACVEAFAAWARDISGSRAVAAPSKRSPSCWYWSVGGNFMAQRLAGALYADARIALTRKRQLAETLMVARFGRRDRQ